MKHILLVDDHSIIRLGLKNIIVTEFVNPFIHESDGENMATKILRKHPIDIMFLDLEIPYSDPISIIKYAKTIRPDIKIIMFTVKDEEIFGLRFMKLGINGYLNKNSDENTIRDAIRLISMGRLFFSESLKIKLTKILNGTELNNPFEKLSTREFQIARSLISGSSINDIADELSISPSSVSTFKARVFQKMDIKKKSIARLIELYNRYYYE